MDFHEAYTDTCSTVGIAARLGNLEALKQLLENGKFTMKSVELLLLEQSDLFTLFTVPRPLSEYSESLCYKLYN